MEQTKHNIQSNKEPLHFFKSIIKPTKKNPTETFKCEKRNIPDRNKFGWLYFINQITLGSMSVIMMRIPTYYYNIFGLTVGICKCNKHLFGKVVIVTGANNGVGFETAKDLAARGARLILACRNEERGTTAREKIVSATGNNDVHYRHLDLASLSSVRKFAEEFIKNEKRLDILINNAGIFYVDNIKTEDDLFVGMQTNHFGPFLLTSLLLPLLKSSSPSRIINVASTAYMRGEIDFENLNMELENKDTYTCYKAYSMSKLCNVYTTLELDRRLKGTGVTVNCLHPGFVDTNIVTSIQWPLFRFIKPVVRLTMKSAWEGAQTIIYLAVAPEVEHLSGRYFSDCRERNLTKKAQDFDIAKKLWEVSESFVKLK